MLIGKDEWDVEGQSGAGSGGGSTMSKGMESPWSANTSLLEVKQGPFLERTQGSGKWGC